MRKLEERIEISVEPEDVWEVLRDYVGVSKWAPSVRRSRSLGGPATGVGSYRVMRHAWGFKLEESVIEWTEGQGYEFAVIKVPFPMKEVREAWGVQHSDNSSTVTTTVQYRMRLGAAGALADRLLVRRLVRREMRIGLEGLKRYVETEAPAPDASSS
jgi:hypothetical protein